MNYIKLIGLASLILFSFFYTDKVINVIREQDPIMVKLDSVKDRYKIDSIDGIVDHNTIIPGIEGRVIDIDKSYKKMKSINKYLESLVEYKSVKPGNSIEDNIDKYIIKGNSSKNMVSLIFIVKDNMYLDKLNEIVRINDIRVNYFVDYSYLIKNSVKIDDSDNINYYSYGNDGVYTPDNIIFSNNLITRLTNKKTNFCLVKEKNDKVLNLCSSYSLYTVFPNIISNFNPYNDIKANLSSGSIILLDKNMETISELNLIINYIEGKGLKIDFLNNLLSEDR